MLHSTPTTKKHTGNLILRFGMAGLLAAGLFFSAPYSAAAETVPSAENTDAGEITIHFTHYDAQDLEFYLNTDQAALAFTDATLTFQDSTMDAPVTMSYLSDDGSYVLYQNSEPVEEVNGTFSVSMVTEPGYTLDMDQISFYVNGQAVANYACQFVGNPYRYGGSSLTNGADCSGFVMAVYAAFGVSLPHSSSALRSVGYGVSIDEIQPGDIVCYSGHVGIYAGNNTLVHASSPETGIKYTSPITYRTVLAVRRIF